MQKILNYDLHTYYTQYLLPKTSFFKVIPYENYLKYSSDSLSSPLTKLNPELRSLALKLYEELQYYMFDKKSKLNPVEHVKKHLKMGINATEDIKDEAYIQVLKQIKDNPDQNKLYRGWNFLAILASTYSPSTDLLFSILNWLLYEIKNNLESNIVKRANYVFARLVRVYEMRRKQIPTEEEIAHIENMKPIMFPIYFFSGSHTLVATESYTTVKELKQAIMNKLELLITKVPYYSLYEVCNKEKTIEERFLEDSDRIVDVIAVWAREIEDHLTKKEKIEFRIYIKVLIFYDFKEDDTDTTTMVYVQTNYDVIMGKLDLEISDAIELGALQLLVNYQTDNEMAYKFLDRNLTEYVPRSLYEKEQPTSWLKNIFDRYRDLPEYSKLEAKTKYLEYVRKSILFQAHQYQVTVSVYTY